MQWKLLFFLFAAVGLAVFVLPSRAQSPSGFGITSQYSIINPSRLPPPARTPETTLRREIPDHPIVSGKPTLQARDPSTIYGPPRLQSSMGGPLQPSGPKALLETPTVAFEGLRDSGFVPLDTDLAVGPEDVLLIENSGIGRYNRSGQQLGGAAFTNWFSDLMPTVCAGGTSTCLLFDPVIFYDQYHGRFLLLVMAYDYFNGGSNWLLSVSSGPLWAGDWKNWVLDATSNGGQKAAIFVDFPKLGFDNEAVYITGNAFDFSNRFLYSKLRILKKSELYNPGAKTLTYWDSWNMKNPDGSTTATLFPARPRGRAMAPYSGGYLVNALDKGTSLVLWQVVAPTSVKPALVSSEIKDAWAYDVPARAPQAGSPVTFDLGDARILKSVIREGLLFTGQNTGYKDEPVTVTYNRIDVQNKKLLAQTRWTNGNFFYPALDIPPSQGPLLLFPNLLPVGTTTANNTLTYAGITSVKPGEGPTGDDRWGDYFGGTIDPIDGGLWVYGEYVKPTFLTGTYAAFFPGVTSQVFDDVPSSHTFFDTVNEISMWQITVGCAPNLYCPEDPVTRGQMAAFIIRGMIGETFTYNTTAYFPNDVPSTHPLYKYVQKMADLGITVGCAPASYCPDAPVTRGQAAVFFIRAKLKSLQGDAFSYPTVPYFSDVPADHVFFKWVQKFRELGMTVGCAPNSFCPDDPMTRGQASRFLARAFLN